MAKKTVHHMDFDSLLAVNREVVLLTREPHEFTPADGEKLKELLAGAEERADNERPEEAVADKAAFLIFKLASGQHFRSGNKRTALVAGLVFLRKNGYGIEISHPDLVSVVDRAGMAAADLDDLYEVIKRLATKVSPERKSWEGAIKQAVESNRKFLIEAGS
ncbi:MAG TPA: Fic family protein [Nitrososphaerales archaeon]|nr:Fic family protein [Nitrososphaerales archaeon]